MKIMVSGHGGHGKDTVAKFIARHTTLRYVASTSWFAAEKMWQEQVDEKPFFISDFPDVQSWYNARRSCRDFWARWIDKYNINDPSRLYRECLESQDILTGVRRTREFEAARPLVDSAIWVEMPGGDFDPTQEYGAEKCDYIIQNYRDSLERTEQCIMNTINAFAEYFNSPSKPAIW